MTARMWARVEKTDTCWLWTGAVNSHGYGVVSIDGKRHLTHRVAYTELVGPIPEGLQLDHLCRVRACCNPGHLEPVTAAENQARRPGRRRSVLSPRKPWTPEDEDAWVAQVNAFYADLLDAYLERRTTKAKVTA